MDGNTVPCKEWESCTQNLPTQSHWDSTPRDIECAGLGTRKPVKNHWKDRVGTDCYFSQEYFQSQSKESGGVNH